MVYKTDSSNQFKIDDRAKISIPLEAKKDSNENTFYIGKLQFNGMLSLEDGQSFMVFISDENCEELQIGPLASFKNYSRKIMETEYVPNKKIHIPLRAHVDNYKKPYYVGELKGKGFIPANRGLFFTIFTSIEGREEIQISSLKINSDK